MDNQTYNASIMNNQNFQMGAAGNNFNNFDCAQYNNVFDPSQFQSEHAKSMGACNQNMQNLNWNNQNASNNMWPSADSNTMGTGGYYYNNANMNMNSSSQVSNVAAGMQAKNNGMAGKKGSNSTGKNIMTGKGQCNDTSMNNSYALQPANQALSNVVQQGPVTDINNDDNVLYEKWEEPHPKIQDFLNEFQNSMHAGARDLNLTKEAVQGWEAVHGTDEYVQNFHDQTMLMVKKTWKYRDRVFGKNSDPRLELKVASGKSKYYNENYNDCYDDNNQNWYSNDSESFRATFCAHDFAHDFENNSTNQNQQRKVYKLSLIDYDAGQNRLKLINYSSCLAPRHFAVGFTGDEKKNDMAKEAKGTVCSLFFILQAI